MDILDHERELGKDVLKASSEMISYTNAIVKGPEKTHTISLWPVRSVDPHHGHNTKRVTFTNVPVISG